MKSTLFKTYKPIYSVRNGCISLWTSFSVLVSVFSQRPSKFTERSRPGVQMICSSFSAGEHSWLWSSRMLLHHQRGNRTKKKEKAQLAQINWRASTADSHTQVDLLLVSKCEISVPHCCWKYISVLRCYWPWTFDLKVCKVCTLKYKTKFVFQHSLDLEANIDYVFNYLS